MKLQNVKITENDFDLFISLDAADKIEYLYDVLVNGSESANDKQLSRIHEQIEHARMIVVKVQDLMVGPYRLCISNYGDIITFNSDSIRVIRHFIKKMNHDGTLLATVPYIKKSEVDFYKYFKAYRVLGVNQPLCEN
jgi:hypothetical protein